MLPPKSLSPTLSNANIAVNRFSYGAKGDDINQAKSDTKKWLYRQLQPIKFEDDFPSSDEMLVTLQKFRKLKKQIKKQKNTNKNSEAEKNIAQIKKKAKHTSMLMSIAPMKEAINSNHSVSWRLLDFFSNHFSVSNSGGLMAALSPTLEREAIAPNLLGDFSNMLLAVEQHPAMLIYLNNEKSFGPHSRMARKRKVGLNENLAREILELHTLGVNGGYKQEDVIELAKGITGWSIKHPQKEHGTGFVYRNYGHEPGNRTLLGVKYTQQGQAQGEQMLKNLAMHPNTAKHVCYKLAHHFVSEKPSQSLINKMQGTWLKNNGNIQKVMQTMFEAPESWLDTPQKYKTPREFIISAYRVIAPKRIHDKALYNALNNLGQKPFNAGSPAGYSDDESDWLGASALNARVEWSNLVSGHIKKLNIEQIMQTALGNSISQNTYNIVMRAESRQQANTLFLMSPEFQRR